MLRYIIENMYSTEIKNTKNLTLLTDNEWNYKRLTTVTKYRYNLSVKNYYELIKVNSNWPVIFSKSIVTEL